MPLHKLENGTWLHASRLPLGCGWNGQCTAPGHGGEIPSPQELRDFCNLGYAEGCGRLPRERIWDAVRFGARTLENSGKNGNAVRVQVRYVCERAHRPAQNGFLEFDVTEARWTKLHPDGRLQRMAECFLESHLEGRKNQSTTQAAAS